MKRLLTALVLLASLAGCAAVPRPTATVDPTVALSYTGWGRVLERFVDDQGRVDFDGVARSRQDLDQFVSTIYDIGPNNEPSRFPSPAHVLAFHLNAYNALAMHKVIAVGVPETLAGLRKVSFFALGKVQVGGQPISLYSYENDVIRPLGEPRVHFALNCMSVGCPRLPREPFLPERLEAQLERETRMFFSESRNLAVDDSQRVVRLTEIMKFFPEDFLRVAPSLIAYVNRYRATPIPEDYRVEYIPYDWTINRQPSR
jgi:Protein of unknown function, DUF547